MSARPLPRGPSQKGVRPASAKPDVNRGFVPRERTDFNELPGVVSEDTLAASTEFRDGADSSRRSIEQPDEEEPDELLDDDALARLDTEERRRSEGLEEGAELDAGAAAAYALSTETEGAAAAAFAVSTEAEAEEEVLSPTRAEELRRVAAEAEAGSAGDESATPAKTGWFSSMMSASKRLVFGKDKVRGSSTRAGGTATDSYIACHSERARLLRALDSLLLPRRWGGWCRRRQA